jgi:DNA-directed RNA polymerase specialized sigma24 family protein
MFRHYRARNAESAPSASAEVDGLDAVAVQKVMKDIPQRHRIAVQWCYVQRNNPLKACQSLGVSKHGLMELIITGRQMLINHLTRVEHCA